MICLRAIQPLSLRSLFGRVLRSVDKSLGVERRVLLAVPRCFSEASRAGIADSGEERQQYWNAIGTSKAFFRTD
jgi:hypothetical protein